jgi:hypothetical protein
LLVSSEVEVTKYTSTRRWKTLMCWRVLTRLLGPAGLHRHIQLPLNAPVIPLQLQILPPVDNLANISQMASGQCHMIPIILEHLLNFPFEPCLRVVLTQMLPLIVHEQLIFEQVVYSARGVFYDAQQVVE